MRKFMSPTLGHLDYEGVIKKITEYIKSNPDFKHKVIVGTDSEARNANVDFATAIVVHRIGKGGIYFWQKNPIQKTFSIQDRIAKETQFSIELAWKLRDTFQSNGLSGYEPEVHLDVGENGKTSSMIHWVTGMVLGSGFDFKIKPESFGATKIADRHT